MHSVTENCAAPPKTSFGYLVPLLLASAYAGVGANIQGVFSLLPIISDEFNLSKAAAGLYSSSHFLSATLVAVFSGRLIDVVGARKGLLFGVGGIGIAMVMVSLAPAYGAILASAFLCGLVFSVITPSVSRGIIEHSRAGRRAFSMGIAHSGGGAGGMAAAALLPVIATRYGWRASVFISALFAILIAAVIWSFYPGPGASETNENMKKAAESGLGDGIRALGSNRRFLALCIFGILLGSVTSSTGSHFALFLHSDFHLSPVKAGIGLAVFQIGGMIGMAGWGIISDWLMGGDRNRALSCTAVLIFFTAIFMAFSAGRLPFGYGAVLAAALFAGFVCIGTMGLFFTTISESVRIERAGMATGMALIFSRTGVIFGPPLFGRIADVTDSYRSSWLVMGAAALIFMIIFLKVSQEGVSAGRRNAGRSE